MATGMTVKLSDDQKAIIITLPVEKPTASSSGKTLVVASSHGNQASGINLNGKAVIIGVNAYVKP